MTRFFERIKFPFAAILLLATLGCGDQEKQTADSSDDQGIRKEAGDYVIVEENGVAVVRNRGNGDNLQPLPPEKESGAATPTETLPDPTPAIRPTQATDNIPIIPIRPTHPSRPTEPAPEEPATVVLQGTDRGLDTLRFPTESVAPATTSIDETPIGFSDPFEETATTPTPTPATTVAPQETPSEEPEGTFIPPQEREGELVFFDPNRDMTNQPFQEVEIPPYEKKDLGPPLVENPENLTALEKDGHIWLDMKGGQVVILGEVCQRESPLEMFACLAHTKEHEAIVACDIKAKTAHAGLLRLGAEQGKPVQYDPDYKPASGEEIEVLVRWKDKQGKIQTARAQEWIYSVAAEEEMKHPWVFAGSGFWVDEGTGEQIYQAEEGDFICVSNFPTAMLDLPIESSGTNTNLLFKPYKERIPEKGTPVTILLTLKKQEAEGETVVPLSDQSLPPLGGPQTP